MRATLQPALQKREIWLKTLLLTARESNSPKDWQAFLKGFSPILQHWVAKHCYDEALREDIMQECLLAIYSKQENYDKQQPLTPWLAAVVRYKIIDFIRRQGVKSYAFATEDTRLEFLLQEAGAVTMPEAFYHRDASRLIDRLPNPKDRDLLNKVTLQHLSHEEAAASLNISKGNLRVRLHRAIEQLKQMVESEK